MTDTFGTDHQGEYHEEGWQDTQPPVDTFHDADVNAEGMATVSEEPGEHEYEKAASDNVAVKKASKLIPVAAGAGLLLVLGAVLYGHFGTGSSAPAPMPQPRPAPVTATSDRPSGPEASSPEDNKMALLDQAPAPLMDSSASNAPLTPNNIASPMPSTGGAATPAQWIHRQWLCPIQLRSRLL